MSVVVDYSSYLRDREQVLPSIVTDCFAYVRVFQFFGT